MTAKEMFEKLGYEYNECYFENELDEIIYSKSGKYTPQIMFNLNHKVVKIYRENNKSSCFNMKLLKAINQQVKELHWDNE
jgi:hypothetical protein